MRRRDVRLGEARTVLFGPVTTAGQGEARTVRSAPAGLDCDATCTERFTRQTVVTLTADAAEGTEFAGWSGTGCTASANTITVTLSQARSCTAGFIFPPLPPPGCDLGAEQDCRNNGGTWDSEICECQSWWLDPLLIPLDGRHLHLTSVTAGVGFDVNGDGIRDRVAWTLPGARAGFLVLDRNGNGVIGSADAVFGGLHRRSRPEGLLWPLKQGGLGWR